MCVPDTFALSKLGRSPGPAGAQARAVWETRGARDAPAGRPKVGRLSEILCFGSENADAGKLGPHLISICK